MARGPKPQPAAVKRQRGSSRRPIVDDAPAALAIGSVKPPAWLKGEAVGIWNAKAPILVQAKLLTEADASAFGRYCRNLALWLKMRQALDDHGETYTVETASGQVHRPRPEFLIGDRAERQLLALEDRFGLNPSERQRIFAARSQSGVSGDLFASSEAANAVRDQAPPQAEGPIGLLN